jgi:hypothetical protein
MDEVVWVHQIACKQDFSGFDAFISKLVTLTEVINSKKTAKIKYSLQIPKMILPY